MRKPVNLATVEEDFAGIEQLLKDLRKRIADVAEKVRLSARRAQAARVHRKASNKSGPQRSTVDLRWRSKKK